MKPIASNPTQDSTHSTAKTVTALLELMPNFIYELCLKRIHDTNIQGVKLDSLRAMCNGAEPVRAATLAQFYHRFEPSVKTYASLIPSNNK